MSEEGERGVAAAKGLLRLAVAVALAFLGVPALLTVFPGCIWLLGLFALLLPVPPVLLAFGTGAAAAAFLTLPSLAQGSEGPLSQLNLWIAVVLGVVVGSVMLRLAFRCWRVRAAESDSVSVASLFVTGIAAAASVWVVLRYPTALEVNQAARLRPAAAAPLWALAALLFCRRTWPNKVAGFFVAIAGFIPMVVASDWFRTNVVKDPLISHTQAVRWVDPPSSATASWRVPVTFSKLHLSPGGTAFATERRGAEALVTRSDDVSRKVESISLGFIDDDRLIAIVGGAAGDEIRGLHWNATLLSYDVSWHHALPPLSRMELEVDSSSARWSVVAPWGKGWKAYKGDDGGVFTEETLVSRHATGETSNDDIVIPALRRESEDLIIRRVGQPPPHAEHDGWDEPLPQYKMAQRTQLWLTGKSLTENRMIVETQLAVECLAARQGAATFVCVAHDRWNSYVWAVGGETPNVIFSVKGRIRIGEIGTDGTVVGLAAREIIWVDPTREVGVQFPYPSKPAHLFGSLQLVALVPGKIGIVDPERRTLSVYRLP